MLPFEEGVYFIAATEIKLECRNPLNLAFTQLPSPVSLHSSLLSVGV